MVIVFRHFGKLQLVLDKLKNKEPACELLIKTQISSAFISFLFISVQRAGGEIFESQRGLGETERR